MYTATHWSAVDAAGALVSSYRPGDTVMTVTGEATVCEVLEVQSSGLLRVRADHWPPGYSALVRAGAVRPGLSRAD